MWYTITSAYGTWSTGYADVYMWCENGTLGGSSTFPNLDADDAIKSSGSTNNYNCIAWAGGIADDWIFPPVKPFGGPWYDENVTPLEMFDDYFGNSPARYSGATTYSRSGATSSNSVVDLWRNATGPCYQVAVEGEYQIVNYYTDCYTHASIRKGSDSFFHGYDWESKPGQGERFFHPRTALENTAFQAYGVIEHYYRATGYASQALESPTVSHYGTIDQSITGGKTVLPKESITPELGEKLSEVLSSLTEAEVLKLRSALEEWLTSIPVQPITAIFTREVVQSMYPVVSACKGIGPKSWAYVFQEFVNAPTPQLILAIAAISWPKYEYVYDDLVRSWHDNHIQEDGAYIAYSSKNIWLQYVKEVLNLAF